MVNPRQRRKNKGPKTSRRIRGPNLRKLKINEATIQAAWDPKKTPRENFRLIGLADKLNDDIGSAALRRKVLSWQADRATILDDVQELKNESMSKAEMDGVVDMTPLDLGEGEIFGQLNALFETERQESSVVKALEEKASVPTMKRVRLLTEDELEYMQRLVAKHGDNTVAMARDLRLNVMQHTPKKLEQMRVMYAAHLQMQSAGMRQ